MASFVDNFTSGLENWTRYGSRQWWTSKGLLKVQDLVSRRSGMLIHDMGIDVNGSITVRFDSLDMYNASDNLIVFRFSDTNNFNYISLQPGTNDDRGVSFGSNEISQLVPNIELFNANNFPLASEQTPNKTNIPNTGIIELEFDGPNYSIKIYRTTGQLVCHGTWTSNVNVVAGQVGFAHTSKWDANINGWDSINVNDAGPVIIKPEIISFSATNYEVPRGDSFDAGWVVTSGDSATTVSLIPPESTVGLEGTHTFTPTDTWLYTLSAWNLGGSDVAQYEVVVSETFPMVNTFTNDGPIEEGETSTLSWTTENATSAFVDAPGVGWVPTSAVSAGTCETEILHDNKEYKITVYDPQDNVGGAVTTVVVQKYPTISFTLSNTPTCRDGVYNLIWSTEHATSVIIDNGIGAVGLNGVMPITADVPRNYSISAINSIGQAIASDTAIVYFQDPIADAGQDVNTISVDGDPVSVKLDGSKSFDPDGLDLEYVWTNGTETLLSSDIGYYKFPVGDHNVVLTVTDPCGTSATDTKQVTIVSRKPPVAVATSTPGILDGFGTTTLDGSTSYDEDGTIVDYHWYHNDVSIGHGSIMDYQITEFGESVFVLVVTDNHGSTDTATVTVLCTTDVSPVSNAGPDRNICSSSETTIRLDGTHSEPPVAGKISWFEWDLSSLGLPSYSKTTSNPKDIYVDIVNPPTGYFSPKLTILADTGFTDVDTMNIRISTPPSISATDVVRELTFGEIYSNVNVSAATDSANPQYVWKFYSNNTREPILSFNDTFERGLVEGKYDVDVYIIDKDTSCRSEEEHISIDVTYDGLRINDFSVTPLNAMSLSDAPINTNIAWNISNATSAYMNKITDISPVSGVGVYEVTNPGGVIEYTLSATDGTNWVTETLYGDYIFDTPITKCKTRTGIVRTYGVDELKFGTDRNINLRNYLPEYVKGTDTDTLLTEFEYYLNNMFTDQRNYTLGETPINVNVITTSACDTSACEMSTTHNDYTFDAVPSIYDDEGNFDVVTPASSVGEVFINDMCDVKSDKISILDKVFRLTELFDPDLIPIDMIQYYAENLGYQAGISRDSISSSSINDPRAREIEQKRYLRFMVRNLPNWYQIKTTRSSIAIMLYSFGIIGDFVYYYTRRYSEDIVLHDDTPKKDKDKTKQDKLDELCSTAAEEYRQNMTPETIQNFRCCISQYKHDIDEWDKVKDEGSQLGLDDWILTHVDDKSLDEDLVSIPEDKGYFSSPHFKLWIDINESTGTYSMDEDRQRMVIEAVNAIKPINTVFDGVAVYWESIQSLYYKPYERVRKHTRILTEGSYLNLNHPVVLANQRKLLLPNNI